MIDHILPRISTAGGAVAPPAGKLTSGHYDAYNRQHTTINHHRCLLYHAAPQRLRHGWQHPEYYKGRHNAQVLWLHEPLVAGSAHERDIRQHHEGHSLRGPDPDERPSVLRQPGHVLQRQGLCLHVDEGPPARLRNGGRQAGLLYLRHVRRPQRQAGLHDLQPAHDDLYLYHALRQGHAPAVGDAQQRRYGLPGDAVPRVRVRRRQPAVRHDL